MSVSFSRDLNFRPQCTTHRRRKVTPQDAHHCGRWYQEGSRGRGSSLVLPVQESGFGARVVLSRFTEPGKPRRFFGRTCFQRCVTFVTQKFTGNDIDVVLGVPVLFTSGDVLFTQMGTSPQQYHQRRRHIRRSGTTAQNQWETPAPLQPKCPHPR